MRLFGVGIVAWVLCVAPRFAQAQLQFAGDAPRILTVDPRTHDYRHELQLGVALLPLDAFYIGVAAAGSYTYHLSDIWAWEVAHGVYSHNLDTSLVGDLQRFDVAPSPSPIQHKMMLTTNLLLKPMAGKFTVFNRHVLQSDTFFAAGLGAVMTTKDWRFAADVGVGFRFWATQAIAVRLDVRDYLVFHGFVPGSVLFILVSGSLNFGDANWAMDDVGPG